MEVTPPETSRCILGTFSSFINSLDRSKDVHDYTPQRKGTVDGLVIAVSWNETVACLEQLRLDTVNFAS